jgi:hypothetical protein
MKYLHEIYISLIYFYKCSVKRLAPGLRRSWDSPGGPPAGPAERKTTGVPPEIPVSNRCPLMTENPSRSVIYGIDVEESFERGRRLRAARRRKPIATRSIIPPREPTTAGTRGMTRELAA